MVVGSEMTFAPIALFAYRRPSHLSLTLEALSNNAGAGQSDLHIFVDGPRNRRDAKDVRRTREIARDARGFRSVVVREAFSNMGLSQSILSGVSEILETYQEVIVVEDDIETSPYFLQYMNDSLAMYRDCDQVASIHGYTYPVTVPLPSCFFLRGADCWGWATWRRAWAHFNPNGEILLEGLNNSGEMDVFDFGCPGLFSDMLRDQIAGRNDSWAIRWYASAFLGGLYTLYPGESLVRNFGFDGSGTHGGSTDLYQQTLRKSPVVLQKIPVIDSAEGREAFSRFLCDGRSKSEPTLSRVPKRIMRRLLVMARKINVK